MLVAILLLAVLNLVALAACCLFVYLYGEMIMSAISDYAAGVKESFTKINDGITGLAGDIKGLNDKITALQASQGQVTPEDQALLDEIQALAKAAADKITALDGLTPPVPAEPVPPASTR